MNPQANRRKFNRSKVEFLVGVQRPGEFEFGLSSQVGAGGMLVMLQSRVAKGDVVEVSFFVPAKKTMIIAKAKVLYVLDPNSRFCYAGICFTEIDSNDRDLIRDYIDQRNSMLS